MKPSFILPIVCLLLHDWALIARAQPQLAAMRNSTKSTNVQVSQRSADSLVFFLAAPGNCFEVRSDPVKSSSKNFAALWIRAVFHEAGTFDPQDTTNPGGPDGSLMYTFNMTENSGLEDTLTPRFVPNKNGTTNADLMALGGVISVKHCGGPDIPFRTGRLDVNPAAVNFSNVNRLPRGDERLSTAKAKLLRLGLSPVDITVLVTGSHSMGGLHGRHSPTLTDKEFVPFDDTPGVFDNNVFKKTLIGYCPVPVDCDIANDPEMRPFVELFARDQNAFFNQYAISFQKLIELSPVPLDSNPTVLKVPVHQFLYEEGSIVNGQIANRPVPQPPATTNGTSSRNVGHTMSGPSSWLFLNPWLSLSLGIIGFFVL